MTIRTMPPDVPITTSGTLPGLARACLHELHARADGWSAAMTFALPSISAQGSRPILLARIPRRTPLPLQPYAEGWAGLGLDPARLLLVDAGDERDLLRAGLDAARCGGLSAVVLESRGSFSAYDLTASRRLVLAAERSGTAVILLRGDAEPRASAAHTRWRIKPAPSIPLPAKTPGPPTIAVELLRRRGGPAGQRWRLEWDEEHGCFRERQALAGAVVPLAPLRAGEARQRAA